MRQFISVEGDKGEILFRDRNRNLKLRGIAKLQQEEIDNSKKKVFLKVNPGKIAIGGKQNLKPGTE